VSVSVPILGFFGLLLLPTPIIFYRIKLGRKSVGIIVFSSLLIMILLVGNLGVDLFFLAALMGLGYFIGEGINKKIPAEKNILYATGLILLASIGSVTIYGNISNVGAIGVISEYIAKNFELTISFYKEMGVPDETIRSLSEAQKEIRQILIRILPALLTAGLLLIGWMNFLLARVILKRKNMLVLENAPLSTWKAPENLVWGIIGSIFLLLMPSIVLKTIGINGLIILMTVYFFQGIAIVSFYLEKKNVPFPMRVLFYGLIAIQQIFALIVIGLGLFDVWINFRRIGINNNNQEYH